MPDRTLVVRAQHGDRDAYERLALEVGDRLIAVAQRMMRDIDRAEDAVPQTLVAIWTELPRLRDPDGRVLVSGGWEWGRTHPCAPVLAKTEHCDPATGSITDGPEMAHARSGHTATLLDDGSVLVAGGGCGRSDLTATAELLR